MKVEGLKSLLLLIGPTRLSVPRTSFSITSSFPTLVPNLKLPLNIKMAGRSVRAIFNKFPLPALLGSRNYGVVSSAPVESLPQESVGENVWKEALKAEKPRTNWTREEIKAIYEKPLMELTFGAVGFSGHR